MRLLYGMYVQYVLEWVLIVVEEETQLVGSTL